MADDIIIRMLNLRENKSKIGSSREISRLKLLLGKNRSRKLYILDSVIILLKENNDFLDKNYIVIALTRKAALAISDSILYLY